MQNKYKSAFPTPVAVQAGHYFQCPTGMTLREYYAGLAMQAILSDYSSYCEIFKKHGSKANIFLAANAVGVADALIAELEKSGGGDVD